MFFFYNDLFYMNYINIISTLPIIIIYTVVDGNGVHFIIQYPIQYIFEFCLMLNFVDY